MRLLTLSAVFLALSSAFLLYALNNDTRQLETKVQQQDRAAAAARSDIAVLKAERAHLARPERIAAFAREQGLAPPAPQQLVQQAGGTVLPRVADAVDR